jgi:hypothetical protein
MNSVPGFDYEIFVAVKNHIKGYVDDLVRLIVADRDAQEGYEASFLNIAHQIGVEGAAAIFADIVTNDELARCTEAWNKKQK